MKSRKTLKTLSIASSSSNDSRKGIDLKSVYTSQGRKTQSSTASKSVSFLDTIKEYLVRNEVLVKYTSLQAKQEIVLLFLIDSSGSMVKDQQIAVVKGIIEETIEKNRFKKIKFGLVSLINSTAKTLSPLTSDYLALISELKGLSSGGRTNLKEGFIHIHQLVKTGSNRAKNHTLYVLTDGKINAGTTSNPFEDAVKFFNASLRSIKEKTVVDTESGVVRLGMAKKLAEGIGAKYLYIGKDA